MRHSLRSGRRFERSRAGAQEFKSSTVQKFSSVQFSSVQFSSVRFGSVRFGSVRFDSVRFGLVRIGSDRFGSVQFSSVSFCHRPGRQRTIRRHIQARTSALYFHPGTLAFQKGIHKHSTPCSGFVL